MAEGAATPPVPLEPTLLVQLPAPEGGQVLEGERVTLGLEKMNDLVARGAYGEAAREAQALLREGSRDVRLVGPFLFGLFVERGPEATPLLFTSILALLRTHWDALGPPGRLEQLADNGLRWLFKTMSKHLEHHERQQDALWQGWLQPATRPPLREALEMADPLIAALSTVLPKAQSVASCRHLVSWLTTFLRALPSEPASAPEPRAPPAEQAPPEQAPRSAREDEGKDEDEGEARDWDEDEDEEPAAMRDEDEDVPRAPPPRAAARAPRGASRQQAPGLPLSPALALLLRKLQAFEALVRGGEFVKAGVVASDVLNVVEHFDPRVYLPELFSPFFAGLSAHAHVLEPVLHETGSLSFRALQQLYQVDLEGFLAQAVAPARGPHEDYED